MMTRATNTLPVVLLLAVCLCGCATPPTDINYRCVLPKTASVGADPDLATAFANELAASARLKVLSQTRLKGKVSNDVTYIVSLKSSASPGVFVNVLFNQPYRTVAVTIAGDIQNPEAGLVAQRAVKVFSAMFPGSRLAPFSGNQSLFGP
jgi:hypothetical protein